MAAATAGHNLSTSSFQKLEQSPSGGDNGRDVEDDDIVTDMEMFGKYILII